jgi:hypothetical protein
LGAPKQLPLAGPCRIRKDAPQDDEDVDEISKICVSITISGGHKDIEKEVAMPRLKYFLTHRCNAGLAGLERGFHEDNLHVQAVADIDVVSSSNPPVLKLVPFGMHSPPLPRIIFVPQFLQSSCLCTTISPWLRASQESNTEKGACLIINRELRECLGWNHKDTRPKGSKIRVTALKDADLHTFEGMLGYCTKDKGMPHYEVIMHNVTDEELRRGAELYIAHGAGKLKNRTELKPANLFRKALNFYQFKLNAPGGEESYLPSILLSMMRTGKYFPAASFVMPYQGSGMDTRRAGSMWRTLVDHEAVDEDDINRIFFHCSNARATLPQRQERYFDHNRLRDEHVHQVQEIVSRTVTEQLGRALREGPPHNSANLVIQRTTNLNTDSPGSGAVLWGGAPRGHVPNSTRKLGDFLEVPGAARDQDMMEEDSD